MKHEVRVTIIDVTRRGAVMTGDWTAEVDSNDFDAEDLTVPNLVAAAWSDLLRDTDMGLALDHRPAEAGEDTWLTIAFDGEAVADELLRNVNRDFGFELEEVAR